jgi:hypothetical protein
LVGAAIEDKCGLAVQETVSVILGQLGTVPLEDGRDDLEPVIVEKVVDGLYITGIAIVIDKVNRSMVAGGWRFLESGGKFVYDPLLEVFERGLQKFAACPDIFL